MSNSRLPKVISNFSESTPPPPSAVSPSDSGQPALWTLDALFLSSERETQKYYRKLYNRLLKSTTPGRSDHRLLIGALDKLDGLMTTLETRQNLQVGSPASSATSSAEPGPRETEDEVVIDLRTQSVIGKSGESSQPLGSDNQFRGSHTETATESASSSTRASSRASG